MRCCGGLRFYCCWPERAKDYVLVPPLAGPGGKVGVGHANGSEYGRGAFAITKANKYPEITMRWADLMYDPYMSAQVIWGPLAGESDELIRRYTADDLRLVKGWYEAAREANERHAERIRDLEL